MNYKIQEHGRNVHSIKFESMKRRETFKLGVFSDLHWDNPDCDRDLLKKDLDFCLENDMPVLLNGDTFCLMQGKYDPRSSKSKIMPEHMKSNYLDAVVEDAIDFFKPYAEIIEVVGYGNHECYHPDTEVLTDKGWINITELDGTELVAQFDSKYITYAKPLDYVRKFVKGLVTIEGNYTKQIVSNKHAVVFNDMRKENAIDVKAVKEIDLPNGRYMNQAGLKMDISTMQLLTAIVMDGCIYDERRSGKSNKARIQIKVSKPEKIEYFKRLFENTGVKHTFRKATKSGVNKLQPYQFTIYGNEARELIDKLNGEKRIPDYFKSLSKVQFEYFISALIETDGHLKESGAIEWNTTSKEDADLVQIMCAFNGYSMKITERENVSGFENGKTQYRCRIKEKLSNKKNCDISTEKYDGEVYCLSMPNGNFITRIDGKVAYSGNTSILRRQETDVIQRFVAGLNYAAKPENRVYAGGYGGILEISWHKKSNYIISYYHGSGGGGVVTRGEINLTRALAMHDNIDCFTMGHIHEQKETTVSKSHYNVVSKKIEQREVNLLVTGTYKDEYKDGYMGWHVERGAPVKPLGGRILEVTFIRPVDNRVTKHARSYKFPV